MHFSYGTNFSLTVNETCRKINSCAAAWKSVLQNRTYDGERKRERLLKGANVNWKAFQGPKQRNFSAIDKRVLKILLENLKMSFPLPERELEVTVSKDILQPHLKASTGWAVRFMHHKGFALCWRTTLEQTSLVSWKINSLPAPCNWSVLKTRVLLVANG